MAETRSLLLKVFSILAPALVALEGTSMAAEVGPSLMEALSKSAPGERVPVIVRFNGNKLYGDPAGARHEKRGKIISALKSRMLDSVNTVSHLISKKGAVRRDLWIINAIALKADAKLVEALSNSPRVAALTLDAVLPAPDVSFAAPSEPEWNISMTGAPALWSMGITGKNVTVAAMDTGVDLNHPDLKGSWRGGANSWFDPYAEHPFPYDADGHGTMVAGLISGGGNGGTSIGMAPDARWVGVKIFNDNGYASLSAIHQGFQWLLDPDNDPTTDDAPMVVNSSWGLGNLDGCSTEFVADIQVMNEAGIATVFASGNHGPNPYTSVSPANGPLSVSAGALDYTGNIAGFSSRGPSACDGSVYPLLCAPGAGVKTADLTYGGYIPQSYSVVSGTSFAAAHVSGALALLSSAFPSAGPNDLVSALLASAIDLGQSGADNMYGAGLIQLKAAYGLLAEKFSGPQPGLAPVTDQDGDGYALGIDCNDNDPGVHPGAQEVKYDGIDQDCNGYDLTIRITRATYSDKYKSLRVEATSALGADAALTLEGSGPMSWSANLNKWVLTVRSAQKPSEVTVSGAEGAEVFVFEQSAPQPVPQPTPLPEPQPEPGPAPAIDQDNDGYASGTDCNDSDPTVHPGAAEVIFDGIDQDCNGFDLTIKIMRATYSSAYKSLRVEATSSLGANAALKSEGFGPMSWSANLRKWVLTVRVAQRPAQVTVSGVEGTVSGQVN